MKMNRLLSLALSVSLVVPAVAQAAIFVDTQGHWARNAISDLSDRNILSGYPNGSFRPEGLITRAEFSAMMANALGLNTSTFVGAAPTFRDVPAGHWAFPSIEAIRATGLVTGYPNGLFLPNRSISRAEAMAILANAARLPMPTDTQINQALAQFSDAGMVPNWARPGVAATVQAGIFANDPNQMNEIDPLQPATRAEVAAMVDNYLAYQDGGQQQTAGTTQQQPVAQGVPSGTSTTVTNQGTLQGQITMVPANTTFTGTLSTPVSSEANRVGDTIVLSVDQPLVSTDNRVIVPAGSQIYGRVAMVEPAGRTGRNAKLDVDFYEVVTPSGERYSITGSVATENGLLEGGTTRGRILKAVGATAVGAGLGAALGTAMGPLSGGEVGRGAIYGTAIGAGVGAVAAAAMKGNDVTLTSGDRIEIRLDQPIALPAQR